MLPRSMTSCTLLPCLSVHPMFTIFLNTTIMWSPFWSFLALMPTVVIRSTLLPLLLTNARILPSTILSPPLLITTSPLFLWLPTSISSSTARLHVIPTLKSQCRPRCFRNWCIGTILPLHMSKAWIALRLPFDATSITHNFEQPFGPNSRTAHCAPNFAAAIVNTANLRPDKLLSFLGPRFMWIVSVRGLSKSPVVVTMCNSVSLLAWTQ